MLAWHIRNLPTPIGCLQLHQKMRSRCALGTFAGNLTRLCFRHTPRAPANDAPSSYAIATMTAQTPAWPGRSSISTFVRSLHLLDLDQLPDWPEVTIQTFGAKASLQHRIRCVEWSLYHLFELYDAKSTRDVCLGPPREMLSTEFV